jgi:hypothetical protein
MDRLFDLTRSKNEQIVLQATREIFDRLLGKPVAVVESQHVGLDLSQLYLRALQRSSAAARNRATSVQDAPVLKPSGERALST